jgi:dTDP-glucose pyrophosphorylase
MPACELWGCPPGQWAPVNLARMDAEGLARLMISPDATVRDAITAIDRGGIQIALVVDAERRLLGTISDGDTRRALLRGVSLDAAATEIIHRNPVTALPDTTPAELLSLMTQHNFDTVPLIEAGRVVDVAVIHELLDPSSREHHPYAVIMAGGQGDRLRPLTDDIPKPMLPVGERPLLETLLEQVRFAGFSKVLLAVNYKAEVIEQHFEDGSRFGVDIEYVRESEALGSGGALQLVRHQLDRPFVVLNADLLTNVDLGALLRFHREEKNVITVGVRQYTLEVPYGVVDLDGTRVTGLKEKPVIDLMVNTGIYAVDPQALSLFPGEASRLDMTELVSGALERGWRVGSFPVREYWLDVGQLADYERAHSDHATYFSAPQ